MNHFLRCLFVFLLTVHLALADTPPAPTTRIKDTDGNPISATAGALNVNVTGSIPSTVSVSNFPSTQAVTGTFWQATQPVSASSLPLPAGAATASGQATEAASLSSIDGKTPALGQAASAASSPVVLASDQSPIPITGTITASNPSIGTNGAAAPASSTQAAGKDGSGNLRPLQVSTAGVLSVDGSAVTQPVSGSVSVSNFPATQPVSAAALPLPTGAATAANQSTANASLSSIDSKLTSPLSVQGTVGAKLSDAAGNAIGSTSGALNVAITSGGGTDPSAGTPGAALPASATYIGVNDGSGNLIGLKAVAGALKVDGSAVTQPVSGTFWQATQPVSAASLPLPAGAATAANQSTANTALAAIQASVGGTLIVNGSGVTQPVSGSVSVSNFPSTQAVTGNFWQATQPVSGTVGVSSLPALPAGSNAIGSVSVSNFPATQPVSGSVAVSNFPATQPVSGTVGISGTVPVSGTFWQATQPVSGSVSVSNLPAVGQTTSSASLPVVLASDQGALPVTATALPLPSGAATAANQSTANTALAAIQSSVAGTLTVNGSGVTQPVSAASLPLPTGAATAANQSTANTSLAAIQSSLSGSLAVVPAAPANGSAANSASVGTGAAVTFTPPSNCVGFQLEAESTNTANIRWSIGTTATASVGMIAEPGRDSNFIPGCGTLSAIALSGTQAVDVIWIQR